MLLVWFFLFSQFIMHSMDFKKILNHQNIDPSLDALTMFSTGCISDNIQKSYLVCSYCPANANSITTLVDHINKIHTTDLISLFNKAQTTNKTKIITGKSSRQFECARVAINHSRYYIVHCSRCNHINITESISLQCSCR